MLVLVTGGAGYIGSITIRQLIAAGHQAVALDSLHSGSASAIPDVPLVIGDVRNPSLLDSVMANYRFDAVIHLAALKSPSESVADPGSYFSANVGGTQAVLDAMRRHGVACFVFSSSCAVYGSPKRLPITEDAPTVPTTPYGESKLLAERMTPWYRPHGIRTAVLRYFNAAGAMDDASLGENWDHAVNLIPVVLRAALGHGPPVEVYGRDYPTPDGTAIRDYIHVLDLADAHIAAMEWLATHDDTMTVNLGTGVGASVLEIIRAVEKAIGHPVPHRFAGPRAGDPPEVYADPARATAALNWRADRRLDEIITSATRWHQRALGD